ncbi:putative N-acetylmannosaminyltransferase [Botrimarina colliarenosi]|uniref:Putative N-acetylmannosaminyltransferase n=1 Tax=Botrimarina colliarenosi TaxID=2528001 RepID=A0A5C6AEL8_9BACT|nr:WecB/TagA/CpsF family glycosyltransferase [Botrimarina colliarenosi]TWT97615.1 putative N-acetylmannosaminyltransferase [Botrimarina colliarenosi]
MIAVASTKPIPVQRTVLFNTRIDCVTLDQAVDQIFDWIGEYRRADEMELPANRYVLTPNVDHVVRLQPNRKRNRSEFSRAYDGASLVVADGWPIVAASRLFGPSLPERVAGSDLTPALLSEAADRGGLRLFLLGGMPGVPELAARRIAEQWPQVEVVGIESPRHGFEQDEQENDRLCRVISAARPDLLIVGLGSPKQELWLHRYYDRLDAAVAIGAGATIDFLAGAQIRAPKWVQRIGMEWAHRALSDPKRLGARYARGLFKFPLLCAAELLNCRRRSIVRVDGTDQDVGERLRPLRGKA